MAKVVLQIRTQLLPERMTPGTIFWRWVGNPSQECLFLHELLYRHQQSEEMSSHAKPEACAKKVLKQATSAVSGLRTLLHCITHHQMDLVIAAFDPFSEDRPLAFCSLLVLVVLMVVQFLVRQVGIRFVQNETQPAALQQFLNYAHDLFVHGMATQPAADGG